MSSTYQNYITVLSNDSTNNYQLIQAAMDKYGASSKSLRQCTLRFPDFTQNSSAGYLSAAFELETAASAYYLDYLWDFYISDDTLMSSQILAQHVRNLDIWNAAVKGNDAPQNTDDALLISFRKVFNKYIRNCTTPTTTSSSTSKPSTSAPLVTLAATSLSIAATAASSANALFPSQHHHINQLRAKIGLNAVKSVAEEHTFRSSNHHMNIYSYTANRRAAVHVMDTDNSNNHVRHGRESLDTNEFGHSRL